MNRSHIVKVALLLVLAATLVFGQATTQVSGAVTDPSGAAVVGATVQVINLATGLSRDVVTDDSGVYTVLQLPPGDYRINVSATGFSRYSLERISLLVATPTTANIKLELGAVTETVSINAEAAQVNTVDASVGNAIGNKPVLQMPLNARNIVSLLALQPGVVYTGEPKKLDSTTDSRSGAVNGGKSDQANVTLDGVDVNDQMDRQAFTSVLRMTPDAMQEFRVTTLNANADQGRSSGAQVALVTKSGTNEVHGSVYWYHRNTITTANNFFNNSTVDPETGKSMPRDVLIRNNYGVSLGGPIKKNKMFLFGNWEGRRDAKSDPVMRSVPSMEMRQGIVQYRNVDGNVVQVTPQDIAMKLDSRGVNQNVLKMLQEYPAPNTLGDADGLNVKGYRFSAPTPVRWNTYIAKADYILDSASKHSLFVRGNLQNDNEQQLPQFPGQQPSSVTLRNHKGMAVGLTSVFSPSLVSNFRWGLTRQGNESTGIAHFPVSYLRSIDNPIGVTRGFVSIIPVHTIAEDMNWVKGAHTVQFGGVARLTQNKRNSYQNSFSRAVSNASWLVDSGDGLNAPFTDMNEDDILFFRYAMSDVMGLLTQGEGVYNYKVDGTVLPQGAPVYRNFRGNEFEFYVQDTWRINRQLTITAGLRYSLMPPIYEADGQQVSPSIPIGDWFDMRGSLASQGKSQLGAGRIAFIPRDEGGRSLYPFHKDNWAPRISVAYSPDAKTSIRAGWGMFYDLFGSGLMRSFDSSAFGLSNSLDSPPAELTIGTAPRFTSFYELPDGLLPAAPEAKFPSTYPDLFSITNGLDDTLKAPYSMNLNFSVGRDLGNGWFVEGSYVGRLSRRSLVRRDAAMPTDMTDPKSGQTYFQAASILGKKALAGVKPAEMSEKVPFFENMFSGAATSTQTATQVAYTRFYNNAPDWTYALYQLDVSCTATKRCPDTGRYSFFSPQYSYLSVFSSVGGGNYHGAQFTAKKRFTNGDMLDFNYTWSKSTDLRSGAERLSWASSALWNPWQPGLSKGVSDYDTTHNFAMMGLYNLPVGRGKRFGTALPKVLDAIIGGWQVSGFWRWSSGFPTSVYETGFWPTNWNNNVFALSTGQTAKTGTNKNMVSAGGDSGPGMFADAAAARKLFTYELPGGIGNRNVLRGDGMFNIDLNVAKRFTMPYSESHSMQFRWETFNLTNTTRFDVATQSLDIGTSNTFGRYYDVLGDRRIMQFGLRYEF